MLFEHDAELEYDEMFGKVVWDKEMPAELDINNDLLQLLACGGVYPDDEQVVDGPLGFLEFRLVDSDHGFVEELHEDSKWVCEADMDDELTLERNTPFLLGIGTDHVNEMSVNVNSHGGLSQQLASAREYVYHGKMNPVELDFGLSPAISIQEDRGIRSLARVPEEALILKIGRHRFGHGNGTIIALEEMTLLQDLYKLKDFYLLAIVSNKPVHMLGKDSHLANNGNLLQQLVSVDELIMDKVLDQVDISPIIMLIDVDKANTVPTYISGESEQPEIYMTTVT